MNHVPMRNDDDFRKALKAALGKLKSADRFEMEIESAVLNAGFSAETARDVVSYLKERRYVDDRRTIINAIERRSGRRAVGREKLKAELLKRGAPEELVDEVLSRPSEGDEVDVPLELLRAKYGVDPDPRKRPTAGRYLASRGFDEELIEAALIRFFGSFDDVAE